MREFLGCGGASLTTGCGYTTTQEDSKITVVRSSCLNVSSMGTSLENGGGIFTTGGGQPVLTNTVICENIPNQEVGGFIDGGGNCISAVCDSDDDGTPDCLDGCPDDPDQTEPGPCGCAGSEVDTDGDGIPDCIDPCPTWPGDCSEDGQTLFVGSDDGADAIQLALTSFPKAERSRSDPAPTRDRSISQARPSPLKPSLTVRPDPPARSSSTAPGSTARSSWRSAAKAPDTVLRGFVLQNGITGSDPIAPSHGTTPWRAHSTSTTVHRRSRTASSETVRLAARVRRSSLTLIQSSVAAASSTMSQDEWRRTSASTART